MTVALLIITDRPAYLERTLASAEEMLPANFSSRIVVNDEDHELGFAGAVQKGWDRVLESGCRWVFHLEDDFIFRQPIPVGRMIEVLKVRPYLKQLALKRQPVNMAEREAGGIVELHPEDYVEQRDGGEVWTEHRRCFTTNPSVYSADLCRLGWPQRSESEGHFTHQLLADPATRFGFWGEKHAPPLVEHIGTERKGHGY